MGDYVYRPDDEERMADFLYRAVEWGSMALRRIEKGDAHFARSCARSAAWNARKYMMLRAVTGRD